MVLFGKSKENIDTSGHEKFAPFLPLFSDFTNRKTPENLINRTSGVFSSMRITGLEPARHRHQILSLARLPIPPYPQDLKLFHIVSERVGVVNKGEGNSFAGIV